MQTTLFMCKAVRKIGSIILLCMKSYDEAPVSNWKLCWPLESFRHGLELFCDRCSFLQSPSVTFLQHNSDRRLPFLFVTLAVYMLEDEPASRSRLTVCVPEMFLCSWVWGLMHTWGAQRKMSDVIYLWRIPLRQSSELRARLSSL